jgi:large subunit ribosomal protein L4
MAKIEIKNVAGEGVGSIELDDAVFDVDVNEHLLWETVKWQLAKRRAGTHKTKTRGEVRGSTKKPYKQKGTGRARHGSVRSPIWVGGGTTFGPRPRSYAYSMPKKARKKALRSALSLRLREGKLVVLDAFPVDDGKTKTVVKALGNLGAPQPAESALIVERADNDLLVRGSRNLAAAKWLAPEGLNVYDVLNHKTLILTADSVKQVEAALRP